MSINYPDVNGHRTSYCSIEFGVNGRKIKGVKSISYKPEVEVGRVYGSNANVIGRTRGRVSAGTGEVEFYQSEWYELVLPMLTYNGLVGWAEYAWPITVTYSEAVLIKKTITDKLEGTRFLTPDQSHSEGTDALVVKVSLDIMKLKLDRKYVALR
jgi:hypothetical protein